MRSKVGMTIKMTS